MPKIDYIKRIQNCQINIKHKQSHYHLMKGDWLVAGDIRDSHSCIFWRFVIYRLLRIDTSKKIQSSQQKKSDFAQLNKIRR